MSSELRPVFVYGTLRSGGAYWQRFLASRTERLTRGRMAGAVLLDCGSYPAAVERPGAAGVTGEVVWVPSGDWIVTLADLDHLEGYRPDGPAVANLFERVVRPVETDGGPVDTWVYLAGAELATAGWAEVPGGDWIAYRHGRLD